MERHRGRRARLRWCPVFTWEFRYCSFFWEYIKCSKLGFATHTWNTPFRYRFKVISPIQNPDVMPLQLRGEAAPWLLFPASCFPLLISFPLSYVFNGVGDRGRLRDQKLLCRQLLKCIVLGYSFLFHYCQWFL